MSPPELEDCTPEVAGLEPVVRRVIAARVSDRHLIDDLVQETLARVLESRRSLEGEALLAYAVVSARNIVTSRGAASTAVSVCPLGRPLRASGSRGCCGGQRGTPGRAQRSTATLSR
jgi:hypothetical protein